MRRHLYYVKGGAPFPGPLQAQLAAPQITDIAVMDHGADDAPFQGKDIRCSQWSAGDAIQKVLVLSWVAEDVTQQLSRKTVKGTRRWQEEPFIADLARWQRYHPGWG